MNTGEGGKKTRGRQIVRKLTIENKLKVKGGKMGRGWATWMIGSKEGTCCDEHWVFYVSNESLNSTSEINRTLYVN